MGYKRFNLQVVLLQCLLAITLFIFMWTLFLPHLVITSINLGIIVVLEVIYILYRINKTNRDLTHFFEAFQYHDGTLAFASDSRHRYFTPLRKSLDKILHEFHDLRSQLEHDKFFYLNALNHIGVGLLVIDPKGIVRFSNRAIQKMLNLGSLDDLEQLNRLRYGLADTVMQMSPANKDLIRVVMNNELVRLSIRCSVFRTGEELFRIISFQDIRSEIEASETEAWQRLIRILTHEIMNSVSPITLTASGIIHMLEESVLPRNAPAIDNKTRSHVLLGLQAIHKRSKGLASFVGNYQRINQLPQPVMTVFPLSDFFTQIETLMHEEFQKNQIRMEVRVTPPVLMLNADEKLIGQVLINLLQNAMYALENRSDKIIKLLAYHVNDKVLISVTDNGKGIPPELLDSIFVPFYSTREQGSGIGLSLSREIMKLHGGGIRVHSEPGKETTFVLIFD
jgi:nitrogen fixation/metabolism regulation signal transduction histidine kinase